ncbi:unnamed protein product [Bursaphelenchus xylophilus]|nr:unnamed protein product [Bursaphelenchus xylophilus]CAG9082635.1 unnamed protein product [Bursaphelenchus xylophilus]
MMSNSRSWMEQLAEYVNNREHLYEGKNVHIHDSTLAVGHFLAARYHEVRANVHLICDDTPKNRKKIRGEVPYQLSFTSRQLDFSPDVHILIVVVPLLSEIDDTEIGTTITEACINIIKNTANLLSVFESKLFENQGMFALVGPSHSKEGKTSDPLYNHTSILVNQLTDSLSHRQGIHRSKGSDVIFKYVQRPCVLDDTENITTEEERIALIFAQLDDIFEPPWPVAAANVETNPTGQKKLHLDLSVEDLFG